MLTEEHENDQRLAAVEAMALKRFDNIKLAAFNNAIQLYGNCPPANMAHEDAVAAKLVKEGSGEPWSLRSIQHAAAFEVNRRVEAGTFN